jgi:hypothetical protein
MADYSKFKEYVVSEKMAYEKKMRETEKSAFSAQ